MENVASERRQSRRLNLRLNVEFLAEGEERQACRIGTTSNVSPGGVYFVTSEWHRLEVGQVVGLRLSGLSGYGTGPLFRSMRAKATVVRMDLPSEPAVSYAKAGVAASFMERPCFEVYRWLE